MQHPSSIIDTSAKIHESVEIGPFCLIGPDVEVGEGTKIESHVILKGPTKIGKRNHIFQFSAPTRSAALKSKKAKRLQTNV